MKRVDLSLASRFKLFRELLGFSQKEFADKLGVSQKAISQWERGERAIPAVILKELKEHLNLNIDWLLTGEGEPFLTSSSEPVKKKDSYEGLSQEDRELLELIKNLPPKDKDLVVQLLKRVAMASTSGSTSETPKNF